MRMGTKQKGSKRIAAYSLILMTVGYIATFPFLGNIWIDLLHGGFEAGLVGGLADWFAVTALFRHPLGIPIPHTALLPNNRNRLTEGLVSVIKNDWLSKESIQEKVKHIPFTDKLSVIVKREIRTESFKHILTKTIKNLIEDVEVEKITPIVKKQLLSALSNVEVGPLLGIIKTKLIQEEVDKKTLDHFLVKVEAWLMNKQTVVKLGRISSNALTKIEVSGIRKLAFNSIKTLFTEEKLGQLVQSILLRAVQNGQRDGDSNRRALLTYIKKELHGLGKNNDFIEVLEKWKDQLLEKELPDELITEKLMQLKDQLMQFVEDPEFAEIHAIPMIDQLLENLTEKSSDLDQWIQQQIILLVEENHSVIGDLVKENLNKLDNKTLVDLIENNIGKDLQWIRVNGAFCGFAIGLVLTGIQAVVVLW